MPNPARTGKADPSTKAGSVEVAVSPRASRLQASSFWPRPKRNQKRSSKQAVSGVGSRRGRWRLNGALPWFIHCGCERAPERPRHRRRNETTFGGIDPFTGPVPVDPRRVGRPRFAVASLRPLYPAAGSSQVSARVQNAESARREPRQRPVPLKALLRTLEETVKSTFIQKYVARKRTKSAWQNRFSIQAKGRRSKREAKQLLQQAKCRG